MVSLCRTIRVRMYLFRSADFSDSRLGLDLQSLSPTVNGSKLPFENGAITQPYATYAHKSCKTLLILSTDGDQQWRRKGFINSLSSSHVHLFYLTPANYKNDHLHSFNQLLVLKKFTVLKKKKKLRYSYNQIGFLPLTFFK